MLRMKKVEDIGLILGMRDSLIFVILMAFLGMMKSIAK